MGFLPFLIALVVSNTSSNLQTYFTPDTVCTPIYIDWLEKNCKKNLYVADYTFTNEGIVEEYLTLRKRGVEIHLILDKLQYTSVKAEKGLVARLRRAGCEVVIASSPKKSAIMHLKCSIVDSQYVEDGSWNYSTPADNQCNSLNFSILPDTDRAKAFMAAWQEIYNHAEALRKTR
jgi:phosphatidylserine/phosphatidylglycerophosphate/cardiolipin synthase-like enzyme